MTAGLIAVFALLSLVIGGMFLVAWLDDRLCAMRDAADPDKETTPKGWCSCGNPKAPRAMHWRSDIGQACYYYDTHDHAAPKCDVDPRTAPTETIVADPNRRRTERGSWGRA